MAYSEYAKSLIKQFHDVIRSEPFNEVLSMDLLDALKKESPKAYASLLRKVGFDRIVQGKR